MTTLKRPPLPPNETDPVKLVRDTLQRIDDTVANLSVAQNHLRMIALNMSANEYGIRARELVKEIAGMLAGLEIERIQWAGMLVEDGGDE